MKFLKHKIPLWRLTMLRRSLFESIGIDYFSRPSYGNMENILLEKIGTDGFFVEAGALDGFFESNTYFLEKYCGWQGILVEPLPDMFSRISTNRPHTRAYNFALVPFGFPHQVVKLEPNMAMSRIHLPTGSNDVNDDSINSASELIDAKAETLTSILAMSKATNIDLLSLDVEGFELEVLKGLDFDLYAPKYILIECLTAEFRESIDEFLTPRYSLDLQINYRDFLYKLNCGEVETD